MISVLNSVLDTDCMREHTSRCSTLLLQKSKHLIEKKEEGNTAFKSGDMERAYALYTEALGIDPHNRITNAKLYNNRATANTKVCLHMSLVVLGE